MLSPEDPVGMAMLMEDLKDESKKIKASWLIVLGFLLAFLLGLMTGVVGASYYYASLIVRSTASASAEVPLEDHGEGRKRGDYRGE